MLVYYGHILPIEKTAPEYKVRSPFKYFWITLNLINHFNFYEILSMIPVSTTTPERSFSTLRRLKTYLWNLSHGL